MSEARQRNVVPVRHSPGLPVAHQLVGGCIHPSSVDLPRASLVSGTGRKLHRVTCKVLLSRVPSLLFPTTSASVLRFWASSPAHLLIWRQNETTGTPLLVFSHSWPLSLALKREQYVWTVCWKKRALCMYLFLSLSPQRGAGSLLLGGRICFGLML